MRNVNARKPHNANGSAALTPLERVGKRDGERRSPNPGGPREKLVALLLAILTGVLAVLAWGVVLVLAWVVVKGLRWIGVLL